MLFFVAGQASVTFDWLCALVSLSLYGHPLEDWRTIAHVCRTWLSKDL